MLNRAHRPGAISRHRSCSTGRRRPRSADSLPLSTSWFRPRPSAKSRAFRWSDSSCAGAWMISMPRAKDLDPKLRALFIDQLGRVRTLAIGPDAILAVRGQELDLIGNAEKLIAENADLSVRLTAAVDRLVSEAETDVSSSAKGALSVQRLSARILLSFAILSLLSSILIVWLYVGRNLIRRLMRLSERHARHCRRQPPPPDRHFRQRRGRRNGASGRDLPQEHAGTRRAAGGEGAGRRPARAAGQGAHGRAGTIGRGACAPSAT